MLERIHLPLGEYLSGTFRISITADAPSADVRLTGWGVLCVERDGLIVLDVATLREDSPTAYDRVDDRHFPEDL